MKKVIVHFKCIGWVKEYAEFEEMFITFLCQQGIYFTYLSALQKHPNTFLQGRNKTLLEVFLALKESKRFTIVEIIDKSLRWFDTEEGGKYWDGVNDKWKTYFYGAQYYTKYYEL